MFNIYRSQADSSNSSVSVGNKIPLSIRLHKMSNILGKCVPVSLDEHLDATVEQKAYQTLLFIKFTKKWSACFTVKMLPKRRFQKIFHCSVLRMGPLMQGFSSSLFKATCCLGIYLTFTSHIYTEKTAMYIVHG